MTHPARPIILYDQEILSIMNGTRKLLVRPARFFRHKTVEPGDSFWVKEVWAKSIVEGIIYRATYDTPDTVAWRSARTMPRLVSRIALEVTSYEFRKLNMMTPLGCDLQGILPGYGQPTRMDTFIYLWNEVFHGRDAWENDPIVQVMGIRTTELLKGTS